MKKIILIICLINLFIKPVNADMTVPTVEDIMILVRNKTTSSDKLKEYMFNYAKISGILDYALTDASRIVPQDKYKHSHECIAKPVEVWFEIIFDDYKIGRIPVSTPFTLAASIDIYKRCIEPFKSN